jgi:two-component system response regulator PrrA
MEAPVEMLGQGVVCSPRVTFKVLVVDDNAAIRTLVKRHLAGNGFSVVVTDSGSEALILIRESQPDLVLLDVEMTGLDGFAVCRVLKKDKVARQIPVIMMSGNMIQEKDMLQGFEGGADDYIIKPLALPLLLARIRAVLRRYQTSAKMEAKLKKAGIELDPAARTIKVNGSPVSLTRKEFDLLATLLAKPDRVHSVALLLETVWGYDPADYNDPGTVEVHVSHLRKKLGSKIGKRIVNVLGHGYKFEE